MDDLPKFRPDRSSTIGMHSRHTHRQNKAYRYILRLENPECIDLASRIPNICTVYVFVAFSVEENTENITHPLHDAAKRGNLSLLNECLSNGVYKACCIKLMKS